MNQTQALEVVRSLANGVDPDTGEVFAAESPYQRPQTVRALFVAAQALELRERTEKRRESLPAKTGAPHQPSLDPLFAFRPAYAILR